MYNKKIMTHEARYDLQRVLGSLVVDFEAYTNEYTQRLYNPSFKACKPDSLAYDFLLGPYPRSERLLCVLRMVIWVECGLVRRMPNGFGSK